MSWQAQKIKSGQNQNAFNETVRPYNNHIKIFPNLFAGMFGFKEKPYFEAVAGAETPVEVQF
jgi:LemA protein